MVYILGATNSPLRAITSEQTRVLVWSVMNILFQKICFQRFLKRSMVQRLIDDKCFYFHIVVQATAKLNSCVPMSTTFLIWAAYGLWTPRLHESSVLVTKLVMLVNHSMLHGHKSGHVNNFMPSKCKPCHQQWHKTCQVSQTLVPPTEVSYQLLHLQSSIIRRSHTLKCIS